MGKRHPNHRLVKIHRSYTVKDVTQLLGVHKNTVRTWIKHGLSTIDDKRPMLILGTDLFTYLKAKRIKNKRPCKPGEMYCLRCRSPKTPDDNMADYHPHTEKLGRLFGICPDCGAGMYRSVNPAKLEQVQGPLEIILTEEVRRIVDCE